LAALAIAPSATRADLPAPPPPPGVIDLTPHELPGNPGPVIHREEGEATWYASAEFLLLTARRGDLDFALSNSDAGNPFASVGSVLEATYPIDGGFRVGGGYVTKSGHWDMSFHFTYFSSEDNRAAATPAGGSLFPTLTRPGINIVDTAVAASYMRYRWFDLELARRFQVEPDLTLKLSTGLRFLTLEDTFRVQYDGQDANAAEVLNNGRAFGPGFLLGGTAEYRLGRRWRVDARGRGTLAYTYHDTRTRETNDAGATVNTDALREHSRVLPVVELGLGLVWEAGGYRVRIGYELQNWFNAFEQPRFTSDVALGTFVRRASDLGVQGVVFSFSKSF